VSDLVLRPDRFRALTLGERIAAQGAPHPDPVPLAGVPVLPMPPHVLEAVREAAAHPRPRESRGVPALREALSAHLRSTQGLAVDPDRELLVTHGAQHGLSIALRALLSARPRTAAVPEVLVPVPTYFFDGTIQLAGARPVHVPTRAEDGWRLDVEALAAAVTPATAAIMVCNPTNPTGVAHTEAELVALVELARRHGLSVLSDESYAGYSHDEPGYVPIRRVAGADPLVVTVTSLSKDFALTNWRVGYVVAEPEVVDLVQVALEWDAINVGDAAQAAARAAVSGPRDWLDPAYAGFAAARDDLVARLGAAGIGAVRPEAGIYLLADLAFLGVTGEELELVLGSHGITALAGDAFGGPGDHARLLYGGPRPGLAQLVDRLVALRDARG
jgi:aspartate/methionine/tyrosine aminotransferase